MFTLHMGCGKEKSAIRWNGGTVGSNSLVLILGSFFTRSVLFILLAGIPRSFGW